MSLRTKNADLRRRSMLRELNLRPASKTECGRGKKREYVILRMPVGENKTDSSAKNVRRNVEIAEIKAFIKIKFFQEIFPCPDSKKYFVNSVELSTAEARIQGRDISLEKVIP